MRARWQNGMEPLAERARKDLQLQPVLRHRASSNVDALLFQSSTISKSGMGVPSFAITSFMMSFTLRLGVKKCE
jgi:hypothetical protein